MQTIRLTALLVITSSWLASVAVAESPFVGKKGALSFEVDAEKSQITFVSDAPAGKIKGVAKTVTGSIRLASAARPDQVAATIVVPVMKLETGNSVRDEHLQSPDWLNAAAAPNIVFAISQVSDLRVTGNRGTGQAHGKFSMNGVDKEITVPVEIAYSADKNVLKVVTKFAVALADFNVKGKNGLVGSKVGAAIDVDCTVYANGK